MSSGPGCSRVGPYLNPPFTSTPRGSRTPPSFQPSASPSASPRRRAPATWVSRPVRASTSGLWLSFKHAATFHRSRHVSHPHPSSTGQLVSKLSWLPVRRHYRPSRHNGHFNTASGLVALGSLHSSRGCSLVRPKPGRSDQNVLDKDVRVLALLTSRHQTAAELFERTSLPLERARPSRSGNSVRHERRRSCQHCHASKGCRSHNPRVDRATFAADLPFRLLLEVPDRRRRPVDPLAASWVIRRCCARYFSRAPCRRASGPRPTVLLASFPGASWLRRIRRPRVP